MLAPECATSASDIRRPLAYELQTLEALACEHQTSEALSRANTTHRSRSFPDIRGPLASQVSEPARDLIRRLIVVEPDERYSWEEVRTRPPATPETAYFGSGLIP